MIRLSCSSCGQTVEVASMIAAGSQPCPACGRLIIGGGVPPGARGEPAPTRWAYEDEEDARSRPKSVGITILGICVILTGSMGLLCTTCCGLLVGNPAFHRGMHEGMAKSGAGQADEMDIMAAANVISTVLIATVIFLGVVSGGLVLAGIGVLRRRQWGRFMTLACGVLVCLGAFFIALQGVHDSIVIFTIVVLFLVFAVTAFLLMTEGAVAEFNHRDAWRFP